MLSLNRLTVLIQYRRVHLAYTSRSNQQVQHEHHAKALLYQILKNNNQCNKEKYKPKSLHMEYSNASHESDGGESKRSTYLQFLYSPGASKVCIGEHYNSPKTPNPSFNCKMQFY